MLVGRSGHDITVVNSKDFKKWCKPTKSKSAESQSANRIGYKCQPRVSQPRVSQSSVSQESAKSLVVLVYRKIQLELEVLSYMCICVFLKH